jgi:ribosomal protein S18 acetylase RimI-like enzyme
MQLRSMTLDDYEAVMTLLAAVEGVALRQADDRDSIARYLARNPGMSFVAAKDGRVAGFVFGGHDGRRGYLHHLVVTSEMRGRGIARALVEAATAAIAADGIGKFHVDVFADNAPGRKAWGRLGWHRRDDIVRYSIIRGDDPNA